MIKLMIKLIAIVCNKIYGYEALNLLFRILPSQLIVMVLRDFGAKIGDSVRIQSPFMVHNADRNKKIFSNLEIGNDCYIGRECIFDLMDKIIIRDRVTISHKCLFNTHTHAGKSNLLVEGILPLSQNTININDDTYIGSGVTILEGVTIGIGAIVGAMSLVNKDVPSKATVVGIPSKVTRQR
jgi:acetyltransferase-like isoleucine patch superfamily enzyme|tara:strand:- start:984 stop:1529 length:546 start_codon:yes stop_codon:yes gene_type:complete